MTSITSKYNIIYSDNPWVYRDRKKIRKDGKTAKRGIGSANSYNVMTPEELMSLPVQNITAENCALFLWTCPPLLDIGIDVMKAWGFRFVGKAFNWIKTYPDGRPFFGVGYYTKSITEDCLLGIKGRMKPVSNKVSEYVETIHPRYLPGYKHSIKPDIFRDKIVELFGDLPRIELFARKQVEGWLSTGLELDGRDIREFLESYSGTKQLELTEALK